MFLLTRGKGSMPPRGSLRPLRRVREHLGLVVRPVVEHVEQRPVGASSVQGLHSPHGRFVGGFGMTQPTPRVCPVHETPIRVVPLLNGRGAQIGKLTLNVCDRCDQQAEADLNAMRRRIRGADR
jgi:hypothetical protein